VEQGERALGAQAWAVFALGSLGFLLSQFYRVSAAVISPDLTRDLGLSVGQLSDLSAAFFYAFAASQVPIVLVLDRVGPRATMCWFSLAGLLGTPLLALAQEPWQALAGRALLGVAMSCNLMGPLALLAAWFPPQRFATFSGVLVGIGYLGSLLAATPLAWMAQGWGWRWAFAVMGLVQAGQVLGVFFWVRDRPPGQAPPPRPAGGALGGLGQGLGLILGQRAFWVLSLGTFFRYGCFAALMGLWAGPFLINGLGYDQVQAGNALLALSLAHILGLPLCGRLSDQTIRSRRWVVAPGLLLSAGLTLALGLLGRDTPFWAVAGLMALIGLAAAPGQVIYAHVKELAPPGGQGAAMTAVNLFTMLGTAVVMQAVAALVGSDPRGLADPAAFAPAWWLMAGGLGLAGLLYFLAPDTRPHAPAKA
jgi:sugar phosphate permease